MTDPLGLGTAQQGMWYKSSPQQLPNTILPHPLVNMIHLQRIYMNLTCGAEQKDVKRLVSVGRVTRNEMKGRAATGTHEAWT